MKAIVTRITYNKSILNGYRRIAHTLLFCGKFVQPAQKTAHNSKIFRRFFVCLKIYDFLYPIPSQGP